MAVATTSERFIRYVSAPSAPRPDGSGPPWRLGHEPRLNGADSFGLEDVEHHLGDDAGGQGDQQDVVVGVHPAIAPRRRPQPVVARVPDIVAAIGRRQHVPAPPAVAVVPRLDPVIAVARGVPVAAPGAGVVAEFGTAAPPVAVVTRPPIVVA